MASTMTVTHQLPGTLEQIYTLLRDQQTWLLPRSGDQRPRTPEEYTLSEDSEGTLTVHIAQDIAGEGEQETLLAVRQIITITPPVAGEMTQKTLAKMGSIPGDIAVDTRYREDTAGEITVESTCEAGIRMPMVGKVINAKFLEGFPAMVASEVEFLKTLVNGE